MSLLGGANLQTAEAKKFKPYIGPVALSLRESGWTTAQIAREIGISPATASMYLWQEGGIRLPTAKDLMRRDGIGVPYRPAKPGRGELWEVEKMLRARTRGEWEYAFRRAKTTIRRLQAEERSRLGAKKRCRWRATKPTLFSLDAPLLEGKATWHDFLVGTNATTDPAQLYEDQERSELLAHVLGGLQIEDIGRLNDWDLEYLRTRLVEEELVSIRITTEERSRMGPVEPKRERRARHRPNFTETVESLGGQDLVGRDEFRENRPWETRNQRRLRRQRESRAEEDRKAA